MFEVWLRFLQGLEYRIGDKINMNKLVNLEEGLSKKYLNMLSELNLVTEDYFNFFNITDKGRYFIQEYKKLIMNEANYARRK